MRVKASVTKAFFCLWAIGITLPSFAQKQKLDCKKFRDGVFQTQSEVSGVITINRHGNIQTETTTKGVKMIFAVHWLNDCSYTLKPSPETIAKYKIPAKALLTVLITKVGPNSYYHVTSSNLNPRKAGSEVVKVGN